VDAVMPMITLYVRPTGPTSLASLARAGQTACAFGARFEGGDQPAPGPDGTYAIRVYRVDLLHDLKLALAERHGLESVAEHHSLGGGSEAQAEGQGYDDVFRAGRFMAVYMLFATLVGTLVVGFSWGAVVAAGLAVVFGLALQPVRGRRVDDAEDFPTSD
jgi:hypothetical protein